MLVWLRCVFIHRPYQVVMRSRLSWVVRNGLGEGEKRRESESSNGHPPLYNPRHHPCQQTEGAKRPGVGAACACRSGAVCVRGAHWKKKPATTLRAAGSQIFFAKFLCAKSMMRVPAGTCWRTQLAQGWWRAFGHVAVRKRAAMHKTGGGAARARSRHRQTTRANQQWSCSGTHKNTGNERNSTSKNLNVRKIQ